MPINYNTPKYDFNLPFWMLDISNKQLFMTSPIPSDISDTKDVILTELPIPGRNAPPIIQSGGGVRKISFTLPLIKKNNTIGNILLLKQVDMLRNQAPDFIKFSGGDFDQTPKVLFNWGIGSIPLIFFVKKADPTHKHGWTNQLGFPQFSEVAFELWLDETHVLYKAEEVWRKMAMFTGIATNAYDTVTGQLEKSRPY